MRKLLVLILAALLVIGAVVAPITGALAHSQLESSTPDDGAELDEPPKQIVLEFNEPVRKNFGQVEVTGPDGAKYSDGDLEVESSTVSQQVSDLDGQGRYQVGWRVVSADGHPVSGEFSFWLGEKGSGSADPGQAANDQSSGQGDQADEQLPTSRLVIGGLGAVLLIAVIAGGLLATRKRDRERGRENTR